MKGFHGQTYCRRKGLGPAQLNVSDLLTPHWSPNSMKGVDGGWSIGVGMEGITYLECKIKKVHSLFTNPLQ